MFSHKNILSCIRVIVLVTGPMTAAGAVEPEKQPIYSNTIGGLQCGSTIATQCKVPSDQRLIIEYVSGFVFLRASATQTTAVSMAIVDHELGLNGNSFHIFPAVKINTSLNTDVFAFSAPLKMMLHPNASFYFEPVASVSVSGYLVKDH